MHKDKLATVLRWIAQGGLTRAAAAEKLEVSGRHVNRLMRAYNVRKPRSAATESKLRAPERKLAKEAREAALMREALQVIRLKKTAEAAALAMKVSVRTMFRWVSRVKAAEIARKSPK